jgi:hypothetical protein
VRAPAPQPRPGCCRRGRTRGPGRAADGAPARGAGAGPGSERSAQVAAREAGASAPAGLESLTSSAGSGRAHRASPPCAAPRPARTQARCALRRRPPPRTPPVGRAAATRFGAARNSRSRARHARQVFKCGRRAATSSPLASPSASADTSGASLAHSIPPSIPASRIASARRPSVRQRLTFVYRRVDPATSHGPNRLRVRLVVSISEGRRAI